MTKAEAKLKNLEDNQLDFIGEIIEAFDSFLEDKGIIIPNDEREDEDEDDCSNIYGSDYYSLEDSIKESMKRWGLIS